MYALTQMPSQAPAVRLGVSRTEESKIDYFEQACPQL